MKRYNHLLALIVGLTTCFSCSRSDFKNSMASDLFDLKAVRNLIDQNFDELKINNTNKIFVSDTILTSDRGIRHATVIKSNSRKILLLEMERSIIKKITILSSLVKSNDKPKIGSAFSNVKPWLLEQIPRHYDQFIGLLDLKDDYICYYFGPLSDSVVINETNFQFILSDLKVQKIVIEAPIITSSDRAVPFEDEN